MDNRTKEQRSKNMSAVKNKNTELEMTVRKKLWHKGLRYRINYKLLGNPDIIFPRQKVAIFCDGCFWHGCPKCYKTPDQNQPFWRNKIQKNRERDSFVTRELTKQGWLVLRYWGCQINKDIDAVVTEIIRKVQHRKGNMS